LLATTTQESNARRSRGVPGPKGRSGEDRALALERPPANACDAEVADFDRLSRHVAGRVSGCRRQPHEIVDLVVVAHLKFHDGEPVLAEDVVASLGRWSVGTPVVGRRRQPIPVDALFLRIREGECLGEGLPPRRHAGLLVGMAVEPIRLRRVEPIGHLVAPRTVHFHIVGVMWPVLRGHRFQRSGGLPT
jgi:hypothetical protein